MITRREPQTWQELQSDVAQILRECGFQAEVEKDVLAARGGAQLDVFAEETVKGRRYSIACECKYWKRPVPQTVIHAFRTVVSDTGANIGYVISRAGFQSGAVSAATFANIKLVTWSEFQLEFVQSWFDSHFSREIQRLEPLMTFAEGLVPTAWFESLTPDEQCQYDDLYEKHADLGWCVQSLGPYMRRLRQERAPELPLAKSTPPKRAAAIPAEILSETAYRELLELCIQHGEAAIRDVRAWRTQLRRSTSGSGPPD